MPTTAMQGGHNKTNCNNHTKLAINYPGKIKGYNALN